MTSIAIVYFSGYGHTVKQAEAVQQGAAGVAGAAATLYRIDQNGDLSEDALAAIGQAWQFKKFADKSSASWFGQGWKNKVAAGFTNSASTNGDKFSTIQYFWTLAMQHSQIWVGTGVMPSNKKEHGPADVNWTAGFGGALAISPSDASPDEAPRSGDLETARLLGRRVAELAAKLK